MTPAKKDEEKTAEPQDTVETDAATEERIGGPEFVPGGNAAEDGVEDVSLGPPRLGGWVDIVDGDYLGRHAAYLQNLEEDDNGVPTLVQVRTRDADNLVLDLPYDSVASTTYNGG